jgi:photosystem II stability/assembly factor-like uncharacterized protein
MNLSRIQALAALTLVLALMSLAGSAQASVGVGHSGWFWGNPLPQGRSLFGIDFAGRRGFAVGSFGTVLRTDDGGSTWAGVGSGTKLNLSEVQTLGPSTVIIGGKCSVRRSDDAGGHFRRLPFTAKEEDDVDPDLAGFGCSVELAALHFPSSAVGYLTLTDGTVLRTADGGRSFSQRTGVPGTPITGGPTGSRDAPTGPTDIRFTGANTGVVVAGGRVYRTTDGASSWTIVASATGNVRAVFFLDASNGFAVGDGGTFLVTRDGGATFASRPLTGAGAGKNLTGVSCASTASCVMTTATDDLVPTAANEIVRTADGGATSSLVSAADLPLFAAGFASASRVAAVGKRGTSVISDDSGAGFSPVGSRLSNSFGARSVRFEEPEGRNLRSYGGRAYVPGLDGRVARTVDGGRSWTAFEVSAAGFPSTGHDIRDVSFPVPAIGYALGFGGSLLRSDNAGESWRILNTSSPSADRAVVALDARRVVLIGPRGVRRSTNGGASFGASKSKAVRRASLFDADRVGSAVVAYGARSVAISRDGGKRWSKIPTPRGKIAQVDFVSRRRGFLLQYSGRIFTTANGGRRWRALPAVGTRAITGIAFTDARRGYAVRESFDAGGPLESEDRGNGVVLRTEDGGRSWTPQLISVPALQSLAASTTGGAFALDVSGSLFATTTGGRLGSRSTLSIKLAKRRLSKAGAVRLTGRLRPARGGAKVRVSVQSGSKVTLYRATVASGGTFNARLKIKRTSFVVAQWRGDDDDVDGDGTHAVKVTVKSKKRRRR